MQVAPPLPGLKVALTGVPSATVPLAGVLASSVGATAKGVRVSEAPLDVTDPLPFVAIQRYCVLLILNGAAVIFNVVVVEPE